jgi:acetolactate synthase I/II/III large subunit
MIGSKIITEYIEGKGIDRVYIFPGGTIAPILDQLAQNNVDLFCARHEQGAGYAALAAARLTQKTQVVMVTSGPGVTNIVTPVADAFYDSAPILIITGQVGTSDLRGTLPIRQRGFQEVNAVDLLRSITKAQYLVKYTDELPSIMEEAFYISMEGRKGPVHIDLPMDVQRGDVSIDFIANNRERNFSNEVDSSIIEQVANY